MPRRFNPLDPLGLFEKSEGRERPDPLGLFKPRTPGIEEGGRYLPPPPDPLGLFSRKKRVGSLENPGATSSDQEYYKERYIEVLQLLSQHPESRHYQEQLEGIERELQARGVSQSWLEAQAKRYMPSIGNPIPIEFNGRLVDIKKQAREILISRGYPTVQVDMALKWAEEWLLGMARRMAPGNIELQRTVVQSAYAEIASRAESWLRGIQAAFAIGAGAR